MVHSNIEPFKIRILKRSEFECIRNSNVQYLSPHFTLVHAENFAGTRAPGIHMANFLLPAQNWNLTVIIGFVNVSLQQFQRTD